MLKKEIIVGNRYMAKVSGRIVPVRVDQIDGFTLKGRECTRYECTNTVTNRRITFHSAQKFRKPA